MNDRPSILAADPIPWEAPARLVVSSERPPDLEGTLEACVRRALEHARGDLVPPMEIRVDGYAVVETAEISRLAGHLPLRRDPEETDRT